VLWDASRALFVLAAEHLQATHEAGCSVAAGDTTLVARSARAVCRWRIGATSRGVGGMGHTQTSSLALAQSWGTGAFEACRPTAAGGVWAPSLIS